MFSDVCPAQTTAAILLMLIATTSSRTFRFVFIIFLIKPITIITFLFCFFFLCELVCKCV